MLDDLKLFFTRAALKKIIMLQSNYKLSYMFNKKYIGISFIILIFGIYAVPKIISRINGVKGDRLDNVENTNVSEDKLKE
jgi:hypothetical protein